MIASFKHVRSVHVQTAADVCPALANWHCRRVVKAQYWRTVAALDVQHEPVSVRLQLHVEYRVVRREGRHQLAVLQ